MRLYSALALYTSFAAAQAAAFKVGNQSFEIVPAFERQADYISALRREGDTNRAQLYAKLVSTPVFNDCAAGGEYSDLGRFNIAAPPVDLQRLAAEIETLRNGRLQTALEEGLRKAAVLLPGPDTKVCVLAAYPAADYIVTDLRGVSGTTVGAGKIWLMINPVTGWEDWARYTIAHEYHHSTWTARFYDRAAPNTLLDYLVFEGRADAFAHIVYPGFDVPWSHALTREQIPQVWETIRAALASTDFQLKRTMMFGGSSVPHWAGYTIGYEIVESYRKRHLDASIASWTAARAQAILEGSDFSNQPSNLRRPEPR